MATLACPSLIRRLAEALASSLDLSDEFSNRAAVLYAGLHISTDPLSQVIGPPVTLVNSGNKFLYYLAGIRGYLRRGTLTYCF